jgi:teichuronic acid exporter
MIMCLMAPLASFLILAAKPIVIFLWTDKWS